MTFIELVEKVAEKTMKTKKETKEMLEVALDTIRVETLLLGRDTALAGFGKFSRKSTKAGSKKIGGVMREVKARDTLKFKSYAKI